MKDQDIVEILLVEDNPNDAEMTMRALQKHNLCNHIVHVRDGKEALDFIFGNGLYKDRNNADRPKIVLLDLKLPLVNGLEVLKTLKENPLTKMIPVVVLTSSSEESDLIESYQMGVNSYIVKPVDYDKFCESIKDIGLYWLLLNQQPAF